MVNGLVRHVVQLIFKNTLQESESLSPALANLPSVSDSCYGLEISSGNFGLAVARRFHAEQLDPMYKQSEKELRERLISINLSTLLCQMSHPVSSKEFELWSPVGSEQMLKWLSLTRDHLHDYLEFLASEVKGFAEGLHSDDEYEGTKQCSFCSATVPFESPETAFCKGIS